MTENESVLSRMLRGMARRVWEMRRSMEHSHQLYAVEYYRNERLEVELADLREKWPLNGFDEPMNIRQFVANHRAWTERANAEVERQRGELQQLRAVADAARALLDAVESPDRAIYLAECGVLSHELDILGQEQHMGAETSSSEPLPDLPEGFRPGCPREGCPCHIPGPVCEECMCVDGQRHCPRCGWRHDRHAVCIHHEQEPS